MKQSPTRFGSPLYEKSGSLQTNENAHKYSNFSDNSQNLSPTVSLLSRSIEKVMDLENKDLKEASSLFSLILKSLNLSKIMEDPKREKIICDLLKCCTRFSSHYLESNKRLESEEVINFGLQIINDFLPSVEFSQNTAKSIFLCKLFLINNSACLQSCSGELQKSKKTLKALLQDPNNTNPAHFAIITNNLSTIFLRKRAWLKAYKYCEMGLFRLEPLIFRQMKDPTTNLMSFNKDLMILLHGYLNYATCLIILQNILDKISDPNLKALIASRTPQTFYKNGHKLATKYLGSESYLARKFLYNLNRPIEKISLLRLETVEEYSQVEPNMKYSNPSESNQKKNFPISEMIENKTQEDSFDRSFDEKEISHNKDFRIKKKTHHRNYKSQIEFGNRVNNKYNAKEYYEIVDKMKEMEENLRKIQELREKYKLEKQMIENDYNYIRNKTYEYYNAQPRMPGIHPSWSMTLPTPINFMGIKPMFNTTFENFWNGQTMGNAESTNIFHQTSPTHNSQNIKNQIFTNPHKDTNHSSYVDSEEKNNEFERVLISLKNDKEKILRENQDKDREIQRLREFLERKEIKKFEPKVIESSDSFPIDSEMNPIRVETKIRPNPTHHQKSKSNVAASNFNTSKTPTAILTSPLNPSLHTQTIPKEKNDETKIEKVDTKLKEQPPAPNPITKPKHLLDSPEIILAKEKVQVNSFNSLANIPNPSENRQKKTVKIEKEKEKEQSSLNSLQSLMDNNNSISKKTALMKSESNKSLVTIISMMDRKGSIRNIKNENKRRSTLIENLPPVNNPYEVFKTLIIPKFSVVKKKMIMDSGVILFEFRTLMNDNKERVYRVEGYNLETAKALKTAILKEEVLKKVLDSINYEDILPLTHPLKSIFKYVDFVKYFIMPFIGIGKNVEQEFKQKYDYKMEIWPRAPGLFNQSAPRKFLGEECLFFFHHTINNQFRIVLTNNITGPSVRCEVLFDHEMMKKFFPYVDNNYGKHDEIHDVVDIVENMAEKGAEKENSEKIHAIIKKYDHEQEDHTENEYLLESFKKTFQQEITNFFDKFVEQFEVFLSQLNIKNYKSIVEHEHFLFFKVSVWGDFGKFRFHAILANSSEKFLRIHLKNAFQTFGPNKSKIYVEGNTKYPYENVTKNFGLEWDLLDFNEKSIVSNFLCDSFRLEAFEKGIGETPLGIKVAIYDHFNSLETGIFYTINEKLWRKNNTNNEAKKKKKYILDNLLDENYNLNLVLKSIGYIVLMDSVRMRENEMSIKLEGKAAFNRRTHINQLENAISINNIVSSYQKNNFPI